LFGYAPGRGGTHASDLYAGIRHGTALMTDGYEVYNGIAKANALVHLGGWAHCRRYFIETELSLHKHVRGTEQLATQFISAIAELYALESRAREKTLIERGQLRAAHSRPVIAKIQEMLLLHLHSVAPNGLLGKALHYMEGGDLQGELR
jgi:hypothetical protein